MWARLILDNHPRTYIEDIILCVCEREWECENKQACMWVSLPVRVLMKARGQCWYLLLNCPLCFFSPPYPFELRVFHWTHLFRLPHPKSWHCRCALPCPHLWVLNLQTQVLGLHNKYFTSTEPNERKSLLEGFHLVWGPVYSRFIQEIPQTCAIPVTKYLSVTLH